ncbi:MAG: hypothetical protein RPS47_10935, partial [Colwellia sp.]
VHKILDRPDHIINANGISFDVDGMSLGVRSVSFSTGVVPNRATLNVLKFFYNEFIETYK